MQKQIVSTTMGPVWLWGTPGAFSGESPLVFVILGAFVEKVGRFFDLRLAFPDLEVVECCLPGQGCPELIAPTLGVFAQAYGEALRQFSNRPLVICGESAGGLVALAIRDVDAPRLALDPPFRPHASSLLVDVVREQLEAAPHRAELIYSILGVGLHDVEARDYTHLLERPARVLIGEHGVVQPEERAAMLSNPGIWLTVVPQVGHVIPANARELFSRVVGQSVEEAVQRFHAPSTPSGRG